MSTESPVPYGTVSSRGEAHTIHFEMGLPHPVDSAWAAVATPAGLRGWLAAADPFEPGPGGAVTLHWLTDGDGGNGVAAPGRITAWQRRRLAEYTVDLRGSFGFTLEALDEGDGSAGTWCSFSNDFTGDGALLLDSLASWHNHFELLHDELKGHPTDWTSWSGDRWGELRAEYALRVPGATGTG